MSADATARKASSPIRADLGAAFEVPPQTSAVQAVVHGEVVDLDRHAEVVLHPLPVDDGRRRAAVAVLLGGEQEQIAEGDIGQMRRARRRDRAGGREHGDRGTESERGRDLVHPGSAAGDDDGCPLDVEDPHPLAPATDRCRFSAADVGPHREPLDAVALGVPRVDRVREVKGLAGVGADDDSGDRTGREADHPSEGADDPIDRQRDRRSKGPVPAVARIGENVLGETDVKRRRATVGRSVKPHLAPSQRPKSPPCRDHDGEWRRERLGDPIEARIQRSTEVRGTEGRRVRFR